MPAALRDCLVAIVGVVGLMALWVGVQRAWARVFGVPGDGDPLAARGGCSGCAHEPHCGSAQLDGVCREEPPGPTLNTAKRQVDRNAPG